ncbi:LysR family transcriptional regulator [Paenibacillus sp. MWE-103]|uniref:LysR family transcriptional regulator n=1 Tax=Paenibacillus artemisiicola TaxID=1172618 RepID=A0ABS3W2Y0_9BACL|nr:LysR family transcriptional regulator [Paenibacillus artemisiicola]MBO7742654.1 LysR family transcriptional regulator [Paenibacillus artemisiicola]
MESGELRVFQAVAREGSITKAAARLGYVQSNVTARIRQLEAELGTPLFHRHNRGMLLSSAGTTLLAYAERIVGMLDEAVKALTSNEKPAGPLAIGSTQTAAAVRLPRLLTAYYARYPDVRLSVATGHTEDMIERVLRYELDGAFIGADCDHPELQSVPAFTEELAIGAHPSVGTLEEAVERPILVFARGCSYRDILEVWMREHAPARTPVMEFGTLEAIIGGVTAGLGISLLPLSVVRKQREDGLIRVFPLDERHRLMTTAFITRKDAFASSALTAFMAMIPAEPPVNDEAAT